MRQVSLETCSMWRQFLAQYVLSALPRLASYWLVANSLIGNRKAQTLVQGQLSFLDKHW